MNRLVEKLNGKLEKREKLFCAYLTLGFPNLRTTRRLIQGFEEAEVDLIELGIPFSDPLADGPIIQKASEKALSQGVRPEDAFDLVSSLRRNGLEIPMIFFSYYNPVLHFGLERFVGRLKESGFDALLCPDLPPEEEEFLPHWLQREEICLIYLASPTTGRERLRMIAGRSTGFIYYVSLKGVTGMRRSLPRDLRRKLGELKHLTAKPVLVGFGVSNAQQVREVTPHCDGIIVGSAIIDSIQKSRGRPARVLRFVKDLVRAVHEISENEKAESVERVAP